MTFEKRLTWAHSLRDVSLEDSQTSEYIKATGLEEILTEKSNAAMGEEHQDYTYLLLSSCHIEPRKVMGTVRQCVPVIVVWF